MEGKADLNQIRQTDNRAWLQDIRNLESSHNETRSKDTDALGAGANV